MTEEIINLENAENLGFLKCFFEGVKQFFKNFNTFGKMLKPILMVLFSLILMSMPTLILNYKSEVFVAICFFAFLFGIFLLIRSFWSFLISLCAISYLAKDIYENKPVKTPSDYFSYVEYHSESYLTYWLWIILFQIVSAAILVAPIVIGLSFKSETMFDIEGNFLSTGIPSAFTILLITLIISLVLLPFFCGINYSMLFWAYNDKTKPLTIIKTAIKQCYVKAFPVIGYFILFAIFIEAILYVINVIPSYISEVTDVYKSSAYFKCVKTMASIVVLLFIESMKAFIMTRYYFELAKK